MAGNSQNSDWFTPGRFAGLLALLVIGSFPGVFAGTESFVLRDYSLFGFPLAGFHRDSFWRGDWPLWNPYHHCGLPFLAQWNTLCLYPPSLIYLLLPLTWGLGLFCLTHMFAGGLGMYWLAKERTGHGLAGALAGVLYAFNGLTQTSLMWPNNIAALGCLPWVLLLVDRGLREGGPGLFGAALIGGLQMLSGAPEIVLLTWFLTAGLAVAHAPRKRVTVLRFGTLVVFVSALAAVQLLPFLDLLQRSSRGLGIEAGWAMAADGWCRFFVPLFYTIRAPTGFYAQTEQFWTLSYYAGMGGMLPALAGFRSSALRTSAWFWWLIALLGIGLATGANGFLYPLLCHLLPLEVVRYPVKFVVLVSVALPMLAALGTVGLVRKKPSARWPLAEWLIVCGLVLWVSLRIPSAEEFGGLRRDWMDSSLARLSFLALLALGFASRHAVSTRVWGMFVLLICFADLKTHSPGLTPTLPAAMMRTAARTEFGAARDGRIAVSRSVERLMKRGLVADHVEELRLRREFGLPDLNLADRVRSVGGFYSLRLAEEYETTRRLHQNATEVHGPLADFMGVTRVSVADPGLSWRDRAGAESLISIGRAAFFAEDEAILRHLASDEYRPEKEVLLPSALTNLVRATADPTSRIDSVEWGDARVSFQTSASRPVIATIAQTWHPNWRVKVDGRPAELLRVNHSFQGVSVPAGRHTVELRYVDRRFQVGAIVSGLTLAGVLMGLLRRRQMRSTVLIEPPAVPLLL